MNDSSEIVERKVDRKSPWSLTEEEEEDGEEEGDGEEDGEDGEKVEE